LPGIVIQIVIENVELRVSVMNGRRRLLPQQCGGGALVGAFVNRVGEK
jgi:hypothetical protein